MRFSNVRSSHLARRGRGACHRARPALSQGPAEIRALGLPLGHSGHAARQSCGPRTVAGRAAGQSARRSRAGPLPRPHRRRLGPRRRQVGAGGVAGAVGAGDPARHARRGHGQHRDPAAHQDLGRARQVARPCPLPRLAGLERHRDRVGGGGQGRRLALRPGAVVGAQSGGLRRPAQPGRPPAAGVRRGLGHRRHHLGNRRRRAHRRRYRDRLAGLRQPDAQRRPLPRLLRQVPATAGARSMSMPARSPSPTRRRSPNGCATTARTPTS